MLRLLSPVIPAEAGTGEHARERFHYEGQAIPFVPGDRDAHAFGEIGGVGRGAAEAIQDPAGRERFALRELQSKRALVQYSYR